MTKKIFTILLLLALLISFIPQKVFASSADFVISSDTNIAYTTGDDYVTVKTTYTRTVENDSYYYPASGEKVFNIPDLPDSTEEEVNTERDYKLNSLKVTTSSGTKVAYTIEEQDLGEGIYIKVPNYKQTTHSSPYVIVLSYKTHDYVTKVVNHITIQAPALPEDVQFQQMDEATGTLTQFNYELSITTDSSIPALTKVFPSTFTETEKKGKTTYSFAQEDRVGNSPTLEFGTTMTYAFSLTYTTPETDSWLPEQYTNLLQALSTNIFEISLPREFDETNQKVYFTNVSPTPSDITQDSEGNILATFEVPSNQISEITISGYITVSQAEYSANQTSYDVDWETYQSEISSSSYLKSYLTATKYWQSSDSYIQDIASSLLDGQDTVLGIIKADYAYVDSKLTYDQNKANSENERIGAIAALQGGASVCMEYADSLIAILRAQGIPARAALGYANIEETEQAQVRHEWVQAWIPNYGWLSIDPTLESSNMLIGASLDRVLWEVFNSDSLSNIRIYSADNVDALTTDGYNINIYGIDGSNIDFSQLDTYIDLVPEKEYSSTEDIPNSSNYDVGQWINTFLKTTTIGRALLITGPIIAFVLVLSTVIFSITRITKNIKARKQNSQPPVI